MGKLKASRREDELAKRKGPCFHAIVGRHRGVARVLPSSLPSVAFWDFPP